MKLNDEGLKNRQWWEEKGYSLPKYDREEVRKATKENPFWIHFGGGNIFRAFQANVVQNLLNDGVLDRGLTVAEGYDYEIIQKMYHPHDDLSILVTLKSTGTIEKTVVGSVMESLKLDSNNAEAYARLREIFGKDSLQMASFTITEKGHREGLQPRKRQGRDGSRCCLRYGKGSREAPELHGQSCFPSVCPL